MTCHVFFNVLSYAKLLCTVHVCCRWQGVPANIRRWNDLHILVVQVTATSHWYWLLVGCFFFRCFCGFGYFLGSFKLTNWPCCGHVLAVSCFYRVMNPCMTSCLRSTWVYPCTASRASVLPVHVCIAPWVWLCCCCGCCRCTCTTTGCRRSARAVASASWRSSTERPEPPPSRYKYGIQCTHMYVC